MEYYVFVTNNCNLDCAYCSGIDINKNKSILEQPIYSFESLKDFIIDTEKIYNSNEIDIVFYGGEPTLNYKYLLDFVTYFDSELNRHKINYILHTNGILLDKIPLQLLKKLRLILVSINYDKIPKQGLYNTYFSKIIDNVRYIRETFPVKLLARLTITENASLYSNVIQISSFFDYVHWQIMNCYQFEDFGKYYSNYKYEISLLFEHWYSNFKKGFMFNYVPFVAAVKLIYTQQEIKSFLCGFNSSSIYIQTNGECYSCPEEMNNEKFLIGNIINGISFSELNFNNIICNKCEFLSNCFGRCGRMHLEFTNAHALEYCKINKEMFSLFINKKDEIINIINNTPSIRSMLDDQNYSQTEYIP